MSAPWRVPFGGCCLCKKWHINSSSPWAALPWMSADAWAHLPCIQGIKGFNIRAGESKCLKCRNFRPISKPLLACKDCVAEACVEAKCRELNDIL